MYIVLICKPLQKTGHPRQISHFFNFLLLSSKVNSLEKEPTHKRKEFASQGEFFLLRVDTLLMRETKIFLKYFLLCYITSKLAPIFKPLTSDWEQFYTLKVSPPFQNNGQSIHVQRQIKKRSLKGDYFVCLFQCQTSRS